MGVNVKQIGSVQGLGNSLVTPSLISVPFTTIVNRAQIPNLAADLKVNFGIDRIHVQQVYEIPNEFGPNGERVWGAVNDTYGQIRIVGRLDTVVSGQGQYVRLYNSGSDFMEITFFGTGLNMVLTQPGAVQQAFYSVDGGPESSNFVPNQSGAISNRNYNANIVCPVVSGLSLGIHTIKIRVPSASAAFLHFNGFEIIGSAASSSNVTVNPGQMSIGGMPGPILASQASFAFNAPATGTRGGRVIVYLSATGSIDEAWQAVDASAAFLTAANHTNEEIARTYFYREFGAGRSDDFSISTAASNFAFTLDDGTTTLVGSNVVLNQNFYSTMEGIGFNAGGFVSITFVGTGLDIVGGIGGTGSASTMAVSVDGASVGSITLPLTNLGVVTTKIVSGLPYGTHTVRVTYGSAGGINVSKFIVYQPKKPSIPAGAVGLADYNVMASYVRNTTADGRFTSSGVLRKANLREAVYSGASWAIASDFGTNYPETGFYIESNAQNAYVEYTFFGTGFEWRNVRATNQSSNVTVTLNGVALNASYPGASSISVAVIGGPTFGGISSTPALLSTASSNVMNNNGAAGSAALQVFNLPLRVHTLRFTQSAATSASTYLTSGAIDIITPTHSYKNNGPFVLQNNLPVGSESIGDLRKVDFQSLRSDQKASAQAYALGTVSTTSTSLIPCPDMSCTVNISGGPVLISYSLYSIVSAVNVSVGCQIYVNGQAQGFIKPFQGYAANTIGNIADQIIVNLPAGVHKIDLYWGLTNGSVGTISSLNRNLTVREL